MRPFSDRHAGPDSAPDDSGRAAGHWDASQATAMLVRDTASFLDWSRAVSRLSYQLGDVDSTTSPRTTPTTRSTRTSNLATRTGTTRTTRGAPSPSAQSYPHPGHAAPSFLEVYQAYYDCRKRKRNTASAMEFELDLERNLLDLHVALIARTYWPGQSTCFAIAWPKPREVWAARFLDRIAHHLLYNKIRERFERRFIPDTFACIEGRGTMRGAERLEVNARSITENWTKPAFYLKLDLANCFVSIDKRVLWKLLAARIPEPFWLDLAGRILWHDPRQNYMLKGDPEVLGRVPPHKRLSLKPETHGLPIGNLSSQFFLNVLLDPLDQYIKHTLKVRHYVRYVDDMVFLGHSPQWLNAVAHAVGLFVQEELGMALNPKKTILQPVDRGIDFVGQVIKPHSRRIRRRTFRHALRQVSTCPRPELMAMANSYFGLLRQASHGHHDRARLARTILLRGRCVNGALTQAY